MAKIRRDQSMNEGQTSRSVMKGIFADAKKGIRREPLTDRQRASLGLPSREEAAQARLENQVGKILRQPKKAILEAAKIVTEEPEQREQLLVARAEALGGRYPTRRGNPDFGRSIKRGRKAKSTSGKKRGRPAGSGRKEESMDEMWARAEREAAAELGTIINRNPVGKRGRGRPPGSKNRK